MLRSRREDRCGEDTKVRPPAPNARLDRRPPSSGATYTTTHARAASAWTERGWAWERGRVAVRTPSLVAFALAIVATLVLASGDARGVAQADGTADAETLYARAEAEDARGDYGNAAAHYRAAVAALPSFRFAAKAITRATLLEAHAEGAWVPFARLEAVRRDPRASSDGAQIDALAAAADAFPPGPTRGEARMLCAEAYIARLHRRADGEGELRKIAEDPSTDALVRRQAATGLVTSLLEDGELDAAQATARELGPALDTRLATKVHAVVRRRGIHLGALAVLASFVALAALSLARAGARGRRSDIGAALKTLLPLAAVFAVYSAVAGGWLASTYEAGNAEPFVVFGAALLPIAAASIAWGAAGSPRRPARIGRALLSAAAVAAAAFLTLEAVNAQYLESFKL
jgi:hypothetical protein